MNIDGYLDLILNKLRRKTDLYDNITQKRKNFYLYSLILKFQLKWIYDFQVKNIADLVFCKKSFKKKRNFDSF